MPLPTSNMTGQPLVRSLHAEHQWVGGTVEPRWRRCASHPARSIGNAVVWAMRCALWKIRTRVSHPARHVARMHANRQLQVEARGHGSSHKLAAPCLGKAPLPAAVPPCPAGLHMGWCPCGGEPRGAPGVGEPVHRHQRAGLDGHHPGVAQPCQCQCGPLRPASNEVDWDYL